MRRARVELGCDECGAPVGTVELTGDGAHRTGPMGRMWAAVPARSRRPLRDAIRRADLPAIFAIDFELLPGWCPRCARHLCPEHWVRWSVFDDDGWHDSIRGRCPAGHERMLVD